MFSIPKFKNPLSIFRSSSSTIDIIENGKNIIAGKNIMEDGSDIKWEDTVEFTFPIKGGRVIKVYDADTITIASRLPYEESPMYRLSVRLNGIDTPEIKGKTANEKRLAFEARDKLHELIFGKMIHLKNISTEKYGRILADVYLDDLHVNQWMLDNGLAVEYDGGTKQRPVEWEIA
jgi:endonuclease YncB( thermonuclease family)